jgi:tetratricopeptide (TPR) repeat protein
MEYIALLIYPGTLMADYWKADVPIARSPGEPLVLLSLMLWAVIGVASVYCWRKARLLFFCVAWFFITILPVSNLPFAIGAGKAERFLYLPSAGFCLLVGSLFAMMARKIGKNWPLLVVLFLVLSGLAVRTYERNKDWKDNLTLALATLEISPTSPLFNQIAASEYRTRGELDRAVPLLQEAIRQRPEEASYHFNLGNVYLDLKDYNSAIASYQEAMRLKPGHVKAMNNLAQAQMSLGQNAEAVKTLTTLLSIDRRFEYAYPNLGSAYLRTGNLAEAARVYRAGLAVFPNFAELHLSLAQVLEKMGQAQEAAQEYQKAYALDSSLKTAK